MHSSPNSLSIVFISTADTPSMFLYLYDQRACARCALSRRMQGAFLRRAQNGAKGIMHGKNALPYLSYNK